MGSLVQMKKPKLGGHWLVVFALTLATSLGAGMARGETNPSLPSTGISTNGHWNNPNIHEVNLLLHTKNKQVRGALANGKLTPEQATAVLKKLRDIRLEESRLYFENGRKDITESQKNTLIAMVDGV